MFHHLCRKTKHVIFFIEDGSITTETGSKCFNLNKVSIITEIILCTEFEEQRIYIGNINKNK